MRFYGQFSPPVDQVIYERYRWLMDEGPGYFMESGAYDGVTESNCKFLEESLGWQGINVEPVPHHFSKLMRNRPESINVHCALSSATGVKRFRHVVHPQLGDNFGNGSLSHTEGHEQALKEQGCKFVEFEVPTMTYDEVLESAGVPRMDLLSLDVEGHELEVLQGMHRPEFLPRLICIETGHDRTGVIHDQLIKMNYIKDGEYLVNSFYRRAA